MLARIAPFLLVLLLVLAPSASAQTLDREQVDAILARVADLRRLAPLSEVRIDALERAEIAAHIRESAATEDARHETEVETKLLQLLGQLEPNVDLAETEVEVLGARVQGLYRPEEAAITVVAGAPELDGRAKVTLAHELTHALQDQHFDLTRLTTHALRNGDRDLAVRALVEGDATVTAQIFATLSLSSPEMQQWTGLSLEGGQPGEPQTSGGSRSPPLYELGAEFVQVLLSAGGWDAVNAAYHRPPQSTEQVLHPRKYLADEAPNLPALGEAAGLLGPGWQVLREDTLGELGFRQVLGRFLPVFRAMPSAAGWGGDRYQLLEHAGEQRLALLLRTTWDSQEDAREFFVAYADSVSARYGAQAQAVDKQSGLLLWSTPDGGIALQGSQTGVTLALAPSPEQARTLLETP